MGQYHMLYNLDKKEYVNPHDIGCMLKIVEQINFPRSMADALFLLIAVSNGRGGGDVAGHEYVGRWGGDRLAVIGDYHEPDDIPGFNFDEIKTYANISEKVNEMLSVVFDEKNVYRTTYLS